MNALLSFLSHRRSLIVSLSLLLLVLTSIALALYTESRHQTQIRQAATVQARVLADSVSAALAFDEVDEVGRYTTALRANPDIEAVAVFDEDGRLVAHYGGENIPSQLAQLDAQDMRGVTAVRAPVVENGVKLGTVYFRVQTDSLLTRIVRYSGAGLLVLMASLMLAVMAFDARALARGNANLKAEMIERQRAEAALRQSQKMEAVGRLTGGIAHDFNNMLAVIIGNLDLFVRRYPDADPKMLRFVAGSQDAAKRAATLTQRLLAFSRRQPLDPKATDVGRSVADMSELLGRTLGETISIEAIRAVGLWQAHVDAGQLETALVNLAVNARDAMPGGGKLTIETSNAYLDSDYAGTQDEVAPGQYVLIAVTDTGTGIPPEMLERVFEPFFTTKPAGLGTGLGLSQVHGFVKQSGGHISLHSEVGVGTTIKLYLPRSKEVSVVSTQSEPTLKDPDDRRSQTVLVVDDEAGVRDFAAAALAELGYDVMSASDADQALKIVEDNARVDILLTDVVMPGRSGRELADAVQKRKPSVRVLYMTGYTQNAIVHNGVLDAGTNLISKPFTISQLEQELDALVER
ncbi:MULTISPECIES: ATP-binding protein [Asticcacaulis]|uniref:ATP-binding protein n=1 Tax=Asticcacaulis TaxID=76890 RepID=UPI001AEB4F5F|nr:MULTISPECIES: ATP-binding protein [Asticcacaulis]MBP2159294.1 signal transduction histidine kinase/CheY-like chemotaxis protein [Asticcacaulis solisilvae]MDR6800339.1 signal transduction histidine kinase/CheY-like chemotaxis protein [Asticcacaulis sp. BE141]